MDVLTSGWCRISSDTKSQDVCSGEEGAEPECQALNLPVDLCHNHSVNS